MKVIDRLSGATAEALARLGMDDGVNAYAVVGSAPCLETANDVDILVLTKGDANEWAGDNLDGWQACGASQPEEGDWISARRGVVNLIVTGDASYFERFVSAARVCHVLRLADKRDRLLVHRVLRDGFSVDGAIANVDAYLHGMKEEKK